MVLKKKSLAENFIYSIIYQLLVTALPILTTPFTARVLGIHANGIHAYTESIVTYFIVLGYVGTAIYGTRKVAYVSKDHDALVQTTWDIIWLRFDLMLITLAVYIPLLCTRNEYAYIYRIQSINIIANGIDLSWFFQGVEDFKTVTLRNMLVKLFFVACLFVFIRSPADLSLYVFLIVGSAFLGNAIMWFFLKDYLGPHSIRRPSCLKAHLAESIGLFIPQVTNYVYSLLDRSMLKWMTGITDYVCIYDYGQRLIRAIIGILQSVGYVMLAHLSCLRASDEQDQIKKYIFQSLNLTLFFAFPFMFGLIGVANDFVPLFYGNGYNQVGQVLHLLSPLIVLTSVNSVLGVQLLIAIGKEKQYTIATTIGAIIDTVLNLFLLLKINVIGACISSLVAETVVLLVLLYMSREYLNIKQILRDNLVPFFSSVAMFMLILLIYQINVRRVYRLLIEVVMAVVFYYIMMRLTKNKTMQFILSKLPRRSSGNK